MDILEPPVLEVGRCLFTPYAPRAIHHDVLLLLPLQHVFDHLDFFAKRIDFRRDCPHEMPHLALVMIAHVNQNRVRLRRQLVERSRIEVHTAIRDIEGLVVQPIRHNLGPNLDGELEKGLAIINSLIEPNAVEKTNAVQVVPERGNLGGRD